MLTNSVGQEIRCNVVVDVLYLLCNVWGLSWEHSDGFGVKIIWKLPPSHVWCLPGMTHMSWDS